MRRAARRDNSFLNSRFSNSLTSTFALGFKDDPLDSSEGDEDGHGMDGYDGYDDTHSVTSSSSGSSGEQDGDGQHPHQHQHGGPHASQGLFMRAGDWQYWLFGGGAQRDHHQGLHQHHHSAGAVHHLHHGDLAPPDKDTRLLSVSVDDIEAQDRAELEPRESLCLNDLSRPQSSASMVDDGV